MACVFPEVASVEFTCPLSRNGLSTSASHNRHSHVEKTITTYEGPNATHKTVTTNTMTTTTIPASQEADQKLYSVKHCNTCNTDWHRDQNASRNILAIAWNTIFLGRCPTVFTRPGNVSPPQLPPSSWPD
ncbi:hypothetical protein DM01DRAFT_1409033 [Hesseltinella vesiculosa]|uniref:Uncharacterized protein n=1 Tax=Hesseltinella vesiculosa TaxID=101127 RepID=A0A1X2GC98_9FUNG|nr:hypothetical protein DM01DRAFT_1409033 [Hesseltinella vesiculosa]